MGIINLKEEIQMTKKHMKGTKSLAIADNNDIPISNSGVDK